MKVSSIIDKNVISGTILLDKPCELYIRLLHKITKDGLFDYIELDSVVVTPKNKFFDYSFINPQYYNDLYVEVNSEKHNVLETGIEYTGESNPLNDRIYIESEFPDLSNTIISDSIIEEYKECFDNILSHSSVTNMVKIKEFTSNQHIVKNNGISFDINENVTVSSEFVLNFSPEITIAINGSKPDYVKLYLINSRGDERILSTFNMYELYDSSCYSSQIISSTKKARIELTYLKDNFKTKSAKINDIFIGRISQYFGEYESERVVNKINLSINDNVMYNINCDYAPLFGLRTILCVGDSTNGHTIQLSNGKVLFKSTKNGNILQLISKKKIQLPINISVFVSKEETIIYENDNVLINTHDNLSIESGKYEASIGADINDQDTDINSKLSVVVYNRNIY